MLGRLKHWAAALKRDVKAIYLASRDPRVPLRQSLSRCCRGLCAIAHRLIPVFIPVLGYVDDLIIVPLGIALAISLIPPEVIEE
jgi:uncharacterized membrane protein YkvA (DUF1232 family)